jgi:hypothetical protein
MRPLEIPLHAFRTKHAAIERKILPRLEADHLVVPDFELDSTLLAAKAAMGFHQPLGVLRSVQARATRVIAVRAKPIDRFKNIRRKRRHLCFTPAN